MFCENCGNELADGIKFCPKCGTPVEVDDLNVVTSETAPGDEKTEKTPVETPEKQNNKSKSGNWLSVAIIGGICAVVLAAVVLVGIFVVKPLFEDGSKQLVYLTDGDVYYLKDMSKPDKAIIVDHIDYEYLEAWFSEDGKYLYYYSKTKNDTLSRIEISKITANSKHPGKYVEKIGSNMESLSFIDSNVFIYIDDKHRLILNEKGNEETLAKGIEQFSLSEDSKMIYYIVSENMELCYMKLSDRKEVVMDKDIRLCNNYLPDHVKYIFYMKNVGELYSVVGDGGARKIDTDVYSVIDTNTDNGKAYYCKTQEVKKKLMDFVEDDTAQSDAILTEPQTREFLKETNESTVMKDCFKDDYEYYSDSDNKEYFYYWLSYDEDADLYYTSSEDNLYYCDYDPDKKNGYKKAKWYLYDGDASLEKWNEYHQAQEREAYRDWLNEQEYTYYINSLYSATSDYDKRLLCEGVNDEYIYVSEPHDMVFYEKVDTEANKVKLEDLYQVEEDTYNYNLQEYLDEHIGTVEGRFCSISGKEYTLDIDESICNVAESSNRKIAFSTAVEEDFDDEYEDEEYEDEEKVNEEDSTLYCFSFSTEGISKLEKVDTLRSGYSYSWVGDQLYYLSDESSELYVYKNGKSQKVAKDVASSVRVTEDGTIINLTDGELELIKGDKKTEIADDVETIDYINRNCILYTRKEDLYLYNGSDKEIRIARDVNYNYTSYAECLNIQEVTYYIEN